MILEPTDGQPVFGFEAGQFVMVREHHEGGEATHPRAFSLASAPCESHTSIELGIKAQGTMSQTLCTSATGAIFDVQGPYGAFILDKTAKQVVFFAGGVGMTPFRSHIRESLLTSLDQKLILFYSGQRPEELMYHQEFLELAEQHKNFIYVPIVTRGCPEGWPGECHRFDEEMLRKYVEHLTVSQFMMCGPGLFMDRVRDILHAEGVDTEKNLHLERY
jgi:phenol hydroxylase P5 protein